jgi:hypothetical protein
VDLLGEPGLERPVLTSIDLLFQDELSHVPNLVEELALGLENPGLLTWGDSP